MAKIGAVARAKALAQPKLSGEVSKKAYKPKKVVIKKFEGIKGY